MSLPPGPWGLPLTGYLPFLRADTHIHFKELAAKYGSVFSTRLGNKLIVVLSDYRMIREAFSKEEFTGRPDTEFSNILGGYGKINFKIIKYYCTSTLRIAPKHIFYIYKEFYLFFT